MLGPTEATYRVEVIGRSGKPAPGCGIRRDATFEFGRVENVASSGVLVFTGCDCLPKPLEHELLFRRSDMPKAAAWVGPVQTVVEDPVTGTVTVVAADRSWWWSGAQATRPLVGADVGVDDEGTVSAAALFFWLLTEAETYHPTGLVIPPGLPAAEGERLPLPSIVKGDPVWPAMADLVGNKIAYSIVGTDMYWGAPAVNVEPGPTLRTSTDWVKSPVNVHTTGETRVTQVRVKGSGGIRAAYPLVDVDVGFGRRTLFLDDPDIGTQAGADQVARSAYFARAAEVVSLTSGEGSLSPGTRLPVGAMIPGRTHPIVSDTTCQTRTDTMRLAAVTINGTSRQDQARGQVLAEASIGLDFQPARKGPA